jgi:hypothetical protein
VRPQASPNAGFMAALARLDEQLHGAASLQVARSRRPQALSCPECGQAVGLSQLSLRHHLRSKHPGSTHEAGLAAEGAGSGGGHGGSCGSDEAGC